MFGLNPIRKPSKGNGDFLEVQEIFPTFQGEGMFTGWPSIFIRLGGCNLACSFCDTEFESFHSIAIIDIIKQVQNLSTNRFNKRLYNLVVITGGEPLRQPINALCEELLNLNYQVQIETNGTLMRELPSGVSIACSPKNQGKGYHPIREDLLTKITFFKFLISKDNPLYKDVTEIGQTKYNIPVYIQPLDEYDDDLNKQNLAYTVEIASRHGYRISIQAHKILKIS